MRFLVVFALIFITGCGGGYVRQSRSARHAFQRGDYEKALQWYGKQKPPARDRLLYLLDQGVILHTAGRFQESLKVFEEAIKLSNELNGPRPVSKTAAIIANDNMIPYQGEPFERLLMNLFQVLNYIGMGQVDEALVEVRRINTRFSNYFKDEAKDYLRNAFVSYVSGTVWEANGKLNDAYIDYKTTYKKIPAFQPLVQDLLGGSTRLGLLYDQQKWQKLFRQSYKPLPPNHGEVILLVQEGVVPEKRSTEEEAGLQILPVPTYPKHLRTPVTVTIRQGKEIVGETVPLYRVDEAAKATLADQKAGIIARGIARLAVKEGAAVAVGTKVDRDLGILLGVLLLATNRADLRSWLTLPRSLQVARFSLPKGSYDLQLEWRGGSLLLKQVIVEDHKKTFVIRRIFD
ncbi:MAG: hypothetical protein Q7S98_00380 [Deltaproteobacteria bacterium]|nr:hypothetical protein [Deltaproteobacteria bacterium]